MAVALKDTTKSDRPSLEKHLTLPYLTHPSKSPTPKFLSFVLFNVFKCPFILLNGEQEHHRQDLRYGYIASVRSKLLHNLTDLPGLIFSFAGPFPPLLRDATVVVHPRSDIGAGQGAALLGKVNLGFCGG